MGIFKYADTRVVWDMEDFPLPEDQNLKEFYSKVERALQIEGIVGKLEIYAYGVVKTEKEWFSFRPAEITIAKESAEKLVRLTRMLLDMLEFAQDHPLAKRTVFLVASKDVPEQNTELFGVMQALKKRGCRVFFVVPDDLPESELPSSDTASLIWRWTSLLDGDDPIDNDYDSDTDSEEGSSSQGPQKRQNTTVVEEEVRGGC